MPTNLYGPGDNFDLETSHVLPALIRKFHEAKIAGNASVEIWGTGKPRREFLHVDDLADACLFLMNHYGDSEIVNVGVGRDLSIRDLAEMIAGIIRFDGSLIFDNTKPDGTPLKMLDVSKLTALGWQAKISLEEGIRRTCQYYTSIAS
jgi:GDP-L-fucose synthase